MTALRHFNFIVSGSVLLLVCSAAAAFFSEPFFLFIPTGFLLLFILYQHPRLLFYLLLFTIPWSTEYLFSFGFGMDLPDEPLMLLTSFSVISLVIVHHKKIIAHNKIHPLLFLLLLQMLWLFIAVTNSTHLLLSVKYFLAKSWYLLAFVAAPLLLWKKKDSVYHSAIVLLGSMMLVTVVVLVRHAWLGFSFETINEALSPLFRNHVNYSALLVCMIPLQILFLKSAKTKFQRRLVIASFFISLPAIYFSFSRGAWLALTVGMFSYWLIKRRWLLKTFLLTILSIIIAVFWLKQNDRYVQFAHDYQTTIFHTNFQEHLTATYQLNDLSTAERFHRWVAGVRMSEESWMTGLGPTTFYQHYKSYTVPAFKTWVSKNEEQSTVHNYFLLLWVEQGGIGMLLFVMLTVGMCWYAQKIYQTTSNVSTKRIAAAAAAVLVMQCTLNFLSDLVETDKVGSIFYLCVAVLIWADQQSRTETNSSKAVI